MGGLGEVHISAAQVLHWQMPQNADRHYCGTKLYTCCGSPASYFLMISDHKEQITAYYSTTV
jgi:hypothetical protein